MWIDTHCHLDAREFAPDRDAVVARARAAGVPQIVLPAVDVANFGAVRELAHAHGLSYALGLHPLVVDAAEEGDIERLDAELDAHRDDPRLVAIGEIGLDHFIAGCDHAKQARFMAAQLALAKSHRLPVIVHVRRAVDPVLKLMRCHPQVTGIAHAFNGSEQQGRVFIDLGFKLGFGGALTFERALRIRHVAQALPLASLVMETDAPDIPPQWVYRRAEERAAGATMRNEPAELPRIAEALAALRDIDVNALRSATTGNARLALPRLAALIDADAVRAANRSHGVAASTAMTPLKASAAP